MSKGIFDSLHNMGEGLGLVTADHPAVTKAGPTTTPIPQPQPYIAVAPQPQQSYVSPAPYVSAATLTPEDEARKQEISQRVYAIASSYVTFQRIRESLDNTSNVAQIVKVMQASNPSLTIPKILSDIDQHLGIIDTTAHDMDDTIQKAKDSRINAPQQAIADQQQAIQQAQETITRAQTAITTANAKIVELQGGIAAAAQKIAEGEAHFKIVLDQLRQPLLQTKTLLSALS